MITYVVGDLFSSPAQVLVNTVNTVGVMGKGLAYTFKRVYPEMFEEYKRHCDNKSLAIGKLHLYKTPRKWVLNFPTKKHWRAKSKIEYIEAGLQKFVDTYESREIKSVSFPMLGCENGGLEWNEVRTVMERYLKNISEEVEIYIHLYRPDLLPFPDYRNPKTIKAQLTRELGYPGFDVFWQSIQAYFSKRKAESLWDQIKDGHYARLGYLPNDIKPTAIDVGCAYVKKVRLDQYLIGHRSDRKRLPQANIIEIIPAENFESIGQELRNMYSAYKVKGTRKQFILSKSQIAEIKEFAKNKQYSFVANILHNVPSIRCVLLSRDPEPNSFDLGLHMLPSQIKSRPSQRNLTL